MFLSPQSVQCVQTHTWKPAPFMLPKRRRKVRLLFNSKCKPLRVESRLANPDVSPRHGPSFRFSVGFSCDSVALRSLCEQGQLDKALDVLFRMEEQGSFPSVEMYKCLLQACARKRALSQARRLHASLAKNGLDSTPVLAEGMVRTLVKCGSLKDAVQLFHELRDPSVMSWTALIDGYNSAGQCQEALRMYYWMRAEGVHPNKYTFISLLNACGSLGDLGQGKQMHAESFMYMCDSELFVATCLVDMYAKCGSILDAQIVFDELPQRDVVVWTTILAAYVQQSQPDKVLQLYAQLQKESVCPDAWIFVSTLQACCMLAEKERNVVVAEHTLRVESLQKGMGIHAEAWRTGNEADIFVGNALVSMYVKCGSIVHAQNMFDMLPGRDVVSWNSLIAGYAQQELAEEALELYGKMSQGGISPDSRTFVSVLQACGNLADQENTASIGRVPFKPVALGKGKAIHFEAWRRGHASNDFIGSALVSFYGKCESIVDAENLFGTCPPLNVVSWNAMLTAFSQQGEAEKAFHLYGQMLEEGISPNDRTFDSLLQACGILAENEKAINLDGRQTRVECLHIGKAIHAEAWMKGYLVDVFVSSTLVSILGKCGSTMDAQVVFDSLLGRDVITWGALLMAYTQQLEWEKVLQLYEEMLKEGVSPDDRIFVSALQCCGMLAESEGGGIGDGSLTKSTPLGMGKVIHAEAWKRGYRSDVFVGSTLVSMYGKCGSIVDAQLVLDGLSDPDVVSWSAMLSVYAQQEEPSKALQLYVQMLEEGVSPDNGTFVALLQAWGTFADEEEVDQHSIKVRSLQMCKEVHAEAWKRGYRTDMFIGNGLISLFGKCGSILDAETVFNRLSTKDVAVWNAMLAAYVQVDQAELVLQLYQKMQKEGVSADEGTIVSVMQGCSSTGSLETCTQIYQNVVSSGNELGPLLASTLIHTYGRFASMVEAQKVFDALPNPDLVSWNALMAGYARQGNCAATLQVYKVMQLAGVKPDGITFLSILSACSHAGLVNEGVEYFISLTRDHGIVPKMDHYVSMVDILGRAGYFSLVEDLLSNMLIKPNLSMWLCLLGACQKHGRVDLGQQAFESAVRLQPRQAAAYVLMSNIYAQAGMWDCVEKVSELRQQAGAWKKPGHSWVDHQQVIHTFFVGGYNHEQQDQICHLLDQLRLRLQAHKGGAERGPIHDKM